MDYLIGTDGGVFDAGGGALLEERSIHHLARRRDEWWAVGEAGLWRDGELVAVPPPGVTLNCVQPSPDAVWVGADSARLYRLEADRLVEDRGFAEAPGREEWHTPWGGPPDVRSMSLGADGELYINVHVGGILRYGPDGPVPTLDINADVHQVVAHPERPGAVVAACALGLAESTDGLEFGFRTDGLAHRYSRAVAVHGDSVLLSASRGPRGGEARLHIGRLGEGPLTPLEGLPALPGNIDTHCVLAGPDGYLVGHGDSVWASTDSGTSWRVLVDGLPDITCMC
jgi:hypothetical protein